jgi:hypothetical protein
MTGTSWVDVSDNLSVVDPPTLTRDTAVAYVFGESPPVIGIGRLTPTEVTIRGVWAQTTADPFYTVYAQFTAACGGFVAVRWSPAGCATTSDAFYTSTTESVVTSLTYPGGDAASADVILWEANIYSPDITRAAWA